MADAELEAIRQRRMQELMAQQGGGQFGQGGQPQSAEQQAQQQQAAREADQQRQGMLHAIMEPAARERLSRIALVKPEKARSVEDILLNAAKRGQLGQKVTEDRLIELLEQVNEQTAQRTKVTIQRRQRSDDDW
mmetsp:Transcript_18060/g.54345  ORF Transcript_18060/g.54345 Transcript_18060/m.54345 type:complete len:134 (+) Transcript_18060:464-865(+)|eukprot:CAMPEP_0206151846 /NCGR_PEP_ID=MMETSP1473-20131121/39026_1 /ASSEMBLY_ACC=CAM_ASM_001109 /TAXON_ID=1461547 /ORGANISM="Stichococcus sp, Strain RCC1054" /LENGTH=133 /DNA_ID=CAMNT_0053549395 /DNA_START=2017 /DNA_END=2418 /DNA_ORIENTATION=-